jgi:hypothetical protein
MKNIFHPRRVMRGLKKRLNECREFFFRVLLNEKKSISSHARVLGADIDAVQFFSRLANADLIQATQTKNSYRERKSFSHSRDFLISHPRSSRGLAQLFYGKSQK